MKISFKSMPLKRFEKRGFALIITLSLMILLTVIAVGLLTLSTISIRSTSREFPMSAAKANARLALMLAIGDLQKYAGPDQRITARSDIRDENLANPRLTGVWKSWEIDANNPPSSDKYESIREDNFLGWLTSSQNGTSSNNIDFANTAIDSNSSTGIALWGDGSLLGSSSSVPDEDKVNAQKVTTDRGRGAFAYAVMDEGVKVRINTPYKDNATSDADKMAQLGSGEIPKVSSIEGLDKLKSEFFEAGSTQFATLEKGVTNQNLGYAVDQLAQGTSKELKPLSHDVTSHSLGLFTDVARGGLKQDFQLMTESDDLPGIYDGKGIYESLLDMKSGSILTDPKWDTLTEFARLYRNSSLSNGNGPTLPATWPSGWQAATSTKNSTTNAITLTPNLTQPPGLVLAPTIEKVQMIFTLAATNLLDRSGNVIHNPQGDRWKASGYHYLVGLQFTPVVTLRNPYNVTLSFNNMIVEFVDIPFSMQVFRDNVAMTPDLVSFDTMTTDNRDGATRRSFKMSLKDKTSSGTVAGGTNFRLLPGEVKVFSPFIEPTWTWANEKSPSWDSVNRKLTDLSTDAFATTADKINNINAIPGLRGDGIGYHRDWVRGAHTSGTNDAIGIWAGCFGARPTSAFHVLMAPRGTANTSRFTISLSATQGTATTGTRSIISALDIDYQRQDGLRSFMLGSSSATLRFPPTGTVSGQQILAPLSTPIKDITLPAMAILSVQGKTTAGGDPSYRSNEEGRIASMPWAFGHSTAAMSKMNVLTEHSANHSHEIDLQTLSLSQVRTDRIPSNINSRGYAVSGNREDTGTSFGILYDVPLTPLQNLAGLNGANPGGSTGYLPRFAQPIGNSWASPLIAPDKISTSGISNTYLDHSYLLNLALYDRFYFSGLASKSGTFGSSTSSSDLASDFSEGVLLDDPRMTLNTPGSQTAADLTNLVSDDDAYEKIAAWQLMKGAFNVNSTSVAAWKAMLGSIRDSDALVNQLVDGTNGAIGSTRLAPLGGTDSGKSRISRFRLPVNGPSSSAIPEKETYWMGARELSDSELTSLAEQIVKKVRLRGPFLSMADFVNRRLGSASDEVNQLGALQQAIDDTTINSSLANDVEAGFEIPANQIATYNYANREAGAGPSYRGAPGYVTQADLLNVLGNAATVRSDTFTIRGYGEARDASGTILAKATCEAVIQRLPEYIDRADAAETAPDSLTEQVNINFGRRFEIIAFRWLSEKEI